MSTDTARLEHQHSTPGPRASSDLQRVFGLLQHAFQKRRVAWELIWQAPPFRNPTSNAMCATLRPHVYGLIPGLLRSRGVIRYSVAAECVVPGVFTCNLRGARDLTLLQRITFSPAQLTSTAHQVSESPGVPTVA